MYNSKLVCLASTEPRIFKSVLKLGTDRCEYRGLILFASWFPLQIEVDHKAFNVLAFIFTKVWISWFRICSNLGHGSKASVARAEWAPLKLGTANCAFGFALSSAWKWESGKRKSKKCSLFWLRPFCRWITSQGHVSCLWFLQLWLFYGRLSPQKSTCQWCSFI